MKNLVSIIIINWNNKFYIERCVNSILNQTYKNLEVIFIDNNSSDGSFEYFNNKYNKFNFIKVKNQNNLGYSGAANQGIELSNGEYIIIMNPDIIMNSDFIERIYDYIIKDDGVAAVSGKLLKYDFKSDEKLNIIDSTGIIMYRNRDCIDRGQNELDIGQYNKIERIFGVCGAVPFYRRKYLDNIKVDKEYFDEDFFAYKEDVDLSWRLNLAGYKCMYFPQAIAYHGRGMGGSRKGLIKFIKNRRSQSKFLRGISFRNHYLMLIKNETYYTYNCDKWKIWGRFLMFLCYSMIFELFNFKYLYQILKLKNNMINKRSNKSEDIENLFYN